MASDEIEVEAALDHGEEQRGFEHRERRADADSGAAAKRKVGEARNFAGANGILVPAFRIEGIRIREKARIALRERLKQENVRTCGNAIAADFAVGDGSAADAPNCRVEAH